MSFKVNSSQQISFNDSVFSLTAREKKALDNSWAKIFADEIFPNIDEERFSVLYSSKASRPNAPVNVIIGALIIKESVMLKQKILLRKYRNIFSVLVRFFLLYFLKKLYIMHTPGKIKFWQSRGQRFDPAILHQEKP